MMLTDNVTLCLCLSVYMSYVTGAHLWGTCSCQGSGTVHMFVLGAMIGSVAGFGTLLGDVCTCVRLGVVVHIVGVGCSGAEITCDGDRTNLHDHFCCPVKLF